MSDFTSVSIGGVPNHSGATPGTAAAQRVLALQEFSGEVLEAFDTMQVVGGKYRVKQVTEGKSHSWPEIWKAVAQSHTPGTEVNEQIIQHGERLITIDDLLVSPVFIADIDQAIMHYDSRQPYTHQLGQALANLDEGNVLRSMLIAARSVPASNELDPGGNEKDGNRILNADISGTDMEGVRADLIEALYLAAQTLDERDVPDNSDRNIFVAPAQYYLLISAGSDIINRDVGGKGSVQEAELRRIAAMNLFKSNNFRKLIVDETVATGTPPAGVAAKYLANNSNTVAVISTPDSVGKVSLIGVQSQAEYSVRHQGWLLLSRMANGLGTLRPEAAVELATI